MYHLNDPQFDQGRFFRDLAADIKLLKQTRAEMQALNLLMHDPKARCIIDTFDHL